MYNFDKKTIQKNFSHSAGDYDSNARVQRRVAHELIGRAGKIEGEVLDIGCGTGSIAELLEREVVGVDLSYSMCAKNYGSCINGDAENLPLKNESFDFVISSLALQWINDVQKFSDEIFRVLKPGGKVAVSTFTSGTLAELETAFAFLDSEPHIIKFKPAMQIFAAFKRSGFSDLVINSQVITYQHKNIFEVMHSIKSVGGGYQVAKTRGLRGKKYFERLENAYKSKFATKNSPTLPVTWQALYITAEKT